MYIHVTYVESQRNFPCKCMWAAKSTSEVVLFEREQSMKVHNIQSFDLIYLLEMFLLFTYFPIQVIQARDAYKLSYSHILFTLFLASTFTCSIEKAFEYIHLYMYVHLQKRSPR